MLNHLRRFREHAALLAILAGIILVFGLSNERFFSAATFRSVANQIPTLTLAATGMTLVLIIGGIDLGVGSVVALGGAVFGVAVLDWNWSVLPGAVLAVGVAALTGLFNGLVIAGLRVPSFIVTLGTLEMARGLAYLTTNSQTKYLDGRLDALATPLGGLLITPAALLAVGTVCIAQLLLTRSVLGRQMVAIGTNEAAAVLAGLPAGRVKVIVFSLAGALGGLAALCSAARLGAADPNGGAGLELSAIAAAVIGGTSLSGGHGSVLRTFFGVLIIATLGAGLAQAGASEPLKRLVTGTVIVLAVIADGLRKKALR